MRLSALGLRWAMAIRALETALVMPLRWPGGEFARGSVRVGSQSEYSVVPANDGTFALTMITPGTSGQWWLCLAQAYGVSPSERAFARASAVSDYRVLAFAYVLGTYSTRTGRWGCGGNGEWAGEGVRYPRPLLYSLTNL